MRIKANDTPCNVSLCADKLRHSKKFPQNEEKRGKTRKDEKIREERSINEMITQTNCLSFTALWQTQVGFTFWEDKQEEYIKKLNKRKTKQLSR